MAKIYCHINQCNVTVQYFAILHDFRETFKTENTFNLTFIRKNKRGRMMRQILGQNRFVARHMAMVIV